MRVLLTAIHVTDPARAHRFYTQVLGFVDVLVAPEHELYVVGPPDDPTGGCQISLEPRDRPEIRAAAEEVYSRKSAVVMLAVDDAESEYHRLGRLGVTFHEHLTKDHLGLHFAVSYTHLTLPTNREV